MHNHSTGPQVIPNVMVAGAALYARDRGGMRSAEALQLGTGRACTSQTIGKSPQFFSRLYDTSISLPFRPIPTSGCEPQMLAMSDLINVLGWLRPSF